MRYEKQKIFLTLVIQTPELLVLMWKGVALPQDFLHIDKVSDDEDWDVKVGIKQEVIELSSNPEDQGKTSEDTKGKRPSKKSRLTAREDTPDTNTDTAQPATATLGPSTTPSTPIHANCACCTAAPHWATGDLAESFSSSLIIADGESPTLLTGPATGWPTIDEDIDFLI
ncbi:hypothetical protein P691DRAFT_765904 [Macrolepiota fuliginosa MF-IS2]|uniref:Uncharacterized protein n=1 Tax=Macrolepiota fuliginosa MF-IS2 TaxID=1400762 RepID=A0A9P6BXS0_9AGAR|nr:hypothetical protein P691DRAFT_765904 [Macrolepiota fuliginosa MF-IS2]